MPTPRLYYEDPWGAAFVATVVAHGSFGDWRSVILDRTGCYPEAGGQMADRGWLVDATAGLRTEIVDVQVDDAGLVHHRVAELPAVGAVIRAEVDRARRRVHMALHTGQHMLSRALLDQARAATVSARLGETACTIDVDVASLADAALARAEDLVNDVIDDDRTIRAFFPTTEELSRLELRRAPKVSENVRVIAVDGESRSIEREGLFLSPFDVTPCGGTHCTRTAQVGLVRITGSERYKGKLRVTFIAGKRARNELGVAHRTLATVAQKLTTCPTDALVALDKLRAELSSERERNKALGAELAQRIAAQLPFQGHLVVATIPNASVEMLRTIAGQITKRPQAVALLAGTDDQGCPVVFSRNEQSAFQCGETLKELAKQVGGRGGGREHHAEGRLPLGSDLAKLWAVHAVREA